MKVKLIENGPIILEAEGPVSYSAAGSSEQKTGSVALCRCGESANKPFCDGTHKKAKFEAPPAELVIQ